jgi:hypothetical protein
MCKESHFDKRFRERYFDLSDQELMDLKLLLLDKIYHYEDCQFIEAKKERSVYQIIIDTVVYRVLYSPHYSGIHRLVTIYDPPETLREVAHNLRHKVVLGSTTMSNKEAATVLLPQYK